jgi:hypothetical protein
MNVPKNANVNIDPKVQKKCSWTGGRVKAEALTGRQEESG